MMRRSHTTGNERGVALVVALLFLLVVTILSVVAARDSGFSLEMSGNLQDQNRSMQSAEAGIFGVLALANTSDDPFDGDADGNPLDGVGDSPLTDIVGGTVATDVELVAFEAGCPRQARASRGSDAWEVSSTACDYYRIDAEHEQTLRARTRVSLGVIKRVLTP